jgi:peptide/nickel transport system permease protein
MTVHILPNIVARSRLGVVVARHRDPHRGLAELHRAGVRPPTPTWGGMIREGFENISTACVVFPSPPFCSSSFAQHARRRLRDAIDPKLRGGE